MCLIENAMEIHLKLDPDKEKSLKLLQENLFLIKKKNETIQQAMQRFLVKEN